MRKHATMFVSYAHANQELASRFVAQFREFTLPSKAYQLAKASIIRKIQTPLIGLH